MNFTVSSSALSNRLQAIGRVITSKNNIPALDSFLFEIEDGTLHVTASDGETTLSTSLELIQAEENGRFTINAKTIQEALKEIPEQPLMFNINMSNMEILVAYQNGKYSIMGQFADEYPTTTGPVENIIEFSVEANMLLTGVSRALFATADDPLRPQMCGIYFDLTPTDLTIVSSDGQKMVCNKITSVQSEQKAAFILPKKPAILLKNLLNKGHNMVKVRFNERNAEILMEDHHMICRLVEGRYPNYSRVIPQNNPNSLIVNRNSLLGALRRVLVFSNGTTYMTKLRLEANQITVSCQNIDFSQSAEESFMCEYEGVPMELGFNGSMLVEIMSNLTSEDVVIKLADPSFPGVFYPSEQAANEYVLMILMQLSI